MKKTKYDDELQEALHQIVLGRLEEFNRNSAIILRKLQEQITSNAHQILKATSKEVAEVTRRAQAEKRLREESSNEANGEEDQVRVREPTATVSSSTYPAYIHSGFHSAERDHR